MAIVVSASLDRRSLASRISSGPEPPPDDRDDVPDSFARVTAAYAGLYARYEAALARGLDLANLDDPRINRSSLPDLTVRFDQEEMTVAFDADLLTTLVELYALRGWSGIRRVEAALAERWTEGGAASGPGGIALSVWAAVVPFFKGARNLLASLVRDALADIERQARSKIETHLKAADSKLEHAWTAEFKMTAFQKLITVPTPAVEQRFTFGNRELADDVFAELTLAVQSRAALDEKLSRAREEARTLAGRQGGYERNQRQGGGTDYRSPYSEDATAENVEQKEEERDRLEAEFARFLTTLEAGILHNCPLALLVLDGLRPGFEQPEMEHRIGLAVDSLRMRVRKLRLALEKADNLVGQRFPDDPARPLGDFGKASSAGIEDTLLDEALLRAGDVGFLPLLSEDTWHDMVDKGVIPKGSFSYFVYFHYITGLLERLDGAATKEEQGRNVLNMSLAVVSLATAFVPVVPGIALILTAVYHGVHDAVTQLARIDRRLTDLVIQPGSMMTGLARIGGLETMRGEMVRTIPRDVLLGIAMMLVGTRWLLTKRLLLGYGYYSDLKTLYDGLLGQAQT